MLSVTWSHDTHVSLAVTRSQSRDHMTLTCHWQWHALSHVITWHSRIISSDTLSVTWSHDTRVSLAVTRSQSRDHMTLTCHWQWHALSHMITWHFHYMSVSLSLLQMRSSWTVLPRSVCVSVLYHIRLVCGGFVVDWLIDVWCHSGMPRQAW